MRWLAAIVLEALLMTLTNPVAPGPPPPKLEKKLLYGKWTMDYGNAKGGKIVFRPDGTYLATYDPDQPRWTHTGDWYVEGNTVVAVEYGLGDFGRRSTYLVGKFSFVIDGTGKFPELSGSCNSFTKFRWHDRQVYREWGEE